MKSLFVMGMMAVGSLSGSYEGEPLKFTVGTRFTVRADSQLPLSCEGGVGDIQYEIDGPECVDVVEDKIHVCDSIPEGNYIVRLRARDQIDQIAQKIINLTVLNGDVEETGSRSEGSTGGSTSQVPVQDPRFNRLISSYSTIITREETTYENNRYPQVEFPDGENPGVINPVPVQISRNRAETSVENRNTVTSQDVALRAASERHQNAVKGITNLLTIIDQARANRHHAESQLEVHVRAYNEALAAQRRAQNEIIAAETRRTQIFSAIGGADGHINELKQKLADLDAQKGDFQIAKKDLLDKISGEQKTKAKLLAELEKINSILAELMKDLNMIKEKCAVIEANINKAEVQLAEAKANFASIMSRRMNAETDVEKKAATVDELRRRLAAAEQALADAEIKLADILSDEKRLPAIIEGIQKRLASLHADREACMADVAQLQRLIDGLGTDDLARQISELESVIIEGRKRVMEIDGNIASSMEPAEDLKAKLAAADDDLAYLKTQISIAEETLRQAYVRGNDANTHVAHGKQNLEAVNARYKEEDQIVCEATLNLERARAEEALARLALEQIIAHYSDALPYSIVPNGNGQGSGNPFGNNPSGSALGPIKNNGDGAPGSFEVKDFTHYLSMAFGAGVSPSHPYSVTKLFPFNFLSKVEGNTITNGNLRGDEQSGIESGVCGGYGPVRVATGEVISMEQDSFKVRLGTGEVLTIDVAPCTQMNANVANYSMQQGDEAIFKGVQRGINQMKASQVTCLSQQ